MKSAEWQGYLKATLEAMKEDIGEIHVPGWITNHLPRAAESDPADEPQHGKW